MGLIYSRIKLMLETKQSGFDFKNTVLIGRQKMNLSKNECKKLDNLFGAKIIDHASSFKNRVNADEFLKKYLAMNKLSVIDYSNYEGADLILDLNKRFLGIDEVYIYIYIQLHLFEEGQHELYDFYFLL